MFHTHQDDEPAREEPQLKSTDAGRRKSSTHSRINAEDIVERASLQEASEEHEPQHEKRATRASHELKRTSSKASNVLERVASRVTTRDLFDPGPPPDGGLKAWTQVAMGWIVIFATWGYVNS